MTRQSHVRFIHSVCVYLNEDHVIVIGKCLRHFGMKTASAVFIRGACDPTVSCAFHSFCMRVSQ